MAERSIAVYILVCLAVVHGYSCPKKQGTFYHADVNTGCQVYHLCDRGEMTVITCPPGEAYDHQSNQCKEQALVDCIETDHYRHKRSTNDVVHTIDIEELRAGIKKLFRTVMPLVRETVKDVAPSIYSQIETDYAPMVEKFRSEIMPFVKDRIVPRAERAFRYARNMAERIFEKVYKSYELTNSSHISIVSCSDIVMDLARDAEPLMKLGKYLTARLNPHSRSKRSIDEDAELDMLVVFMEPFFIEIIDSVQKVAGRNISVSDIADHVEKNQDTLIRIAKYYNAALNPQNRNKRSTDEEDEEVPDMLIGFMEPVFARVINTIQKLSGGEGNSITTKIILPVIYEMVANQETTFYLKQIFWNLKSAFSPIISDMLGQQKWNSSSETTVKIPREEVSTAFRKIVEEVEPRVVDILEIHWRSILYKLGDNGKLVLGTYVRMRMTSPARANILKDSIIRFFQKHYEKLKSSSPTHYYSYALTEILRDLRPIEVTIGQLLLEYMKITPNSVFNQFFSKNSLIYRLIMGESAPHYAVPRW